MTHPDSLRHGRLTHTPISVADAVTFLRRHAPGQTIPTNALTAVAVTGSATGQVAAVALISSSTSTRGGVAQATIALTVPTARMRTMLLTAAYERASAMGFRVVLVHGDERPHPDRIDIMYPLVAPRRTRPATGRQLARHLYGRPDNRGSSA